MAPPAAPSRSPALSLDFGLLLAAGAGSLMVLMVVRRRREGSANLPRRFAAFSPAFHGTTSIENSFLDRLASAGCFPTERCGGNRLTQDLGGAPPATTWPCGAQPLPRSCWCAPTQAQQPPPLPSNRTNAQLFRFCAR